METKSFKVPNMTCNGCVSTVRGEIEQIKGVVHVDVNKPTQLVTVEWETPASWSLIEQKLIEIEYLPVEA
ncbi:MAG: heavy-metal-associated domain-containing protein [Anaerolineae bacterium]|nr:heavy-metal-associated domain-containing protein [Anaerolineae bacterium]